MLCAAACSVYACMRSKTRPQDLWFSVMPFITLNVIQFSRLAQNTAHLSFCFERVDYIPVLLSDHVICKIMYDNMYVCLSACVCNVRLQITYFKYTTRMQNVKYFNVILMWFRCFQSASALHCFETPSRGLSKLPGICCLG